jgi:hypothetical protein
MALDEHRAKFKVLQWAHQDPAADPSTIDNTPKAKKNSIKQSFRSLFSSKPNTAEAESIHGSKRPASELSLSTHDSHVKESGRTKSQKDPHLRDPRMGFGEERDREQDKLAAQFEKHDGKEYSLIHQKKIITDVKEIWFAGAHADVGGGAV